MNQTFLKTIQGHDIEFSRLLYPLRYQIFIRKENSNPLVVTLKKDDKAVWHIDSPDKLPDWVNEMSLPIHYAIDENEADRTISKVDS
jgi:hypothetical protein